MTIQTTETTTPYAELVGQRVTLNMAHSELFVLLRALYAEPVPTDEHTRVELAQTLCAAAGMTGDVGRYFVELVQRNTAKAVA